MNKVTKDGITAKIKKVKYARVSEKFTHCIITLKNGFEVTGESACVDPANYNQDIGEQFAYDNAFDKIWMLEIYLLQEKLYLKNKFESKNKGWSTSPNEALNLEVFEDREERLHIQEQNNTVHVRITGNQIEKSTTPFPERE